MGLGFMIFNLIQAFVFINLFVYQKKFLGLTDKQQDHERAARGHPILHHPGGRVRGPRGGQGAKEIIVLTRMAYVVAGFLARPAVGPHHPARLIFATYSDAEGKSMDAARAFTTIVFFNFIRFPSRSCSWAFSRYEVGCCCCCCCWFFFFSSATLVVHQPQYLHRSGSSEWFEAYLFFILYSFACCFWR